MRKRCATERNRENTSERFFYFVFNFFSLLFSRSVWRSQCPRNEEAKKKNKSKMKTAAAMKTTCGYMILCSDDTYAKYRVVCGVTSCLRTGVSNRFFYHSLLFLVVVCQYWVKSSSSSSYCSCSFVCCSFLPYTPYIGVQCTVYDMGVCWFSTRFQNLKQQKQQMNSKPSHVVCVCVCVVYEKMHVLRTSITQVKQKQKIKNKIQY